MKQQIKFIIMAMLAIPAQLHAQESLGTIDVTASRVSSPSIKSSKSVTVVDREAIEKSHAENVVDLLKGQPGIVVSDTSGIGAKSRVDLGGYGETAAANNVVLVDGRRVNSLDLSGTDWSQIPVDQIEHIEIVHGGGSVLYGNGAVGGVINIITRIPESGGDIAAGGGSFGSYTGALRMGADAGKMRVETNVSTAKTDGYRQNSLFERMDAGARAEADLDSGFSFRFAGNYHRDRSGLPGALSAAQVAADRKQSNNPQDFSKTSDSFVNAGLGWIHGDLELDLSGGLRDRQTHAEFVSFGSNSDIVIRTQSLQPKLNYQFQGALPVRLLAGMDLDSSRGSFEYGGAFPLPLTSIKRERMGLYGQVEVGGDNGRWNVNAGLRSERIKDTFSQAATAAVSDRKSAWELGASVALVEALRLRLSAGSSLRFPLLDERYSFFTGTVDTTLKPQTGRHYGMALRYETQKSWLEASLSRADISNEVFFNPLTFSNENYTDKTRHDVVMLSGHINGGELLQFGGNVTYSKATFRGGFYDGKQVPAVASVRAAAEWVADWSQALQSGLKLTYVGSSYLISDQSNIRSKLPAYLLVDVVVGYHIGNMELFARIDNLTNRKYSSYGVYSAGFPPFVPPSDNFYPAAGIGVRGGASYHF